MPSTKQHADEDDAQKDAVMLPEEAPFQVGEEIDVGDLSTVQQPLLPASRGVLAEIRKAEVKATKDGQIKYLKLQLALPNGIMFTNPDGELERRYVGKVTFTSMMDLIVWAGPTKTSQWFKDRQHLLGIKEFCAALGRDAKSLKINDEFLISLIGAQVLVNIRHEEETQLDVTGTRTKTGTFRERFGGWRKVVEEPAE